MNNMKKQITKVFALILMGIFATTMAFAQGTGGHDHTNVEKYASGYTKGPEWELFHFPEYDSNGNIIEVDGKKKLRSINYYNGGVYDELNIEKLKGFNWKGRLLNEVENGEEFFLCNMATGEYLQIGDYWGTNEMTNHAGITYQLTKAYSQRKKENNPAWNADPAYGYWLSPKMPGSDMPDRVVGRVTVNDGIQGHYEHNKYFVLRDRDEYHDGKYHNWKNSTGEISTTGDGNFDGSSIQDPGGFLFYFHPVTKDGKQAYVIYTHRQTEFGNSGNKERSEFWDRESYLMLKSAGHLRAGYNAVRFEKFAGQMRGQSLPGVKMTFHRTGPTASDVTVNITDMKGTAIPGATASLVSVDFTAPNDNNNLKSSGATAITNGSVLAPNVYGNGENAEITYTFRIQDLPSTYSFNAANLDVYNMNGSGTAQSLSDDENKARNFQFFVQMGSSVEDLSPFASKTENTNIVKSTNVPNSYGDLNYGPQILTASSTQTATSDFYIKVTLKKTSAGGCYAGIGAVSLYNNSNLKGKYWGDYRDEAIGDETNFSVDYVSIDEALNNAANTDENLWKIVSKSEREKFRLVASDENPVDMTYRIQNPKFYTSYTYVWNKSECEDLGGGHYTHSNDQTAYHWQWFDDDRKTHASPNHHVHPYNITYDDTRANEYHKIGTGFFHRFWASGIGNANVKERAMTFGQESNYVGSMWKGTANLQQEIGTEENPLREGLYVVCVKGFFAPHDMEKYDGAGNCNGTATTSALSTSDEWYKEAIITNGGEDDGKWRRSHDSYLFAWSNPDGKPLEVRRMLPSIYEGAIDLTQVTAAEKSELSKDAYLDSDDFKKYSQLGVSNTENQINLLKDATNFAKYSSAFFGKETGTWSVPKTLSAAGRWFNVIDGIDDDTSSATFKNAQAYRIALPVYVGSDGLLTIGVDHTKNPSPIKMDGYADVGMSTERKISVEIPASGENEWVCFDDFELIYLGKDESELFVIDELNGQGTVGGYEYINGETGFPFTAADNDSPNYDASYIGTKSPKVQRQNNTRWRDIFDDFDITNASQEDLDNAKVVKNVVIRRSMTTNGWNSIVLPVPLTRAQVEEGFGEGTMVSQLETVRGRTLIYKPVSEQSDGTYLMAGFPYIIYPTKEPYVPVGEIYEREPFTIKVSTTRDGVAGLYFKSSQYHRNYEIDHEMAGPIYFIPNVWIKMTEVFSDYDGLTGSDQWTRTATFEKTVNVRGDNRSFKLKEKASYDNPGIVEQYSYYFNKGQIRYATESFPTTKGLFAYVQLTYMDGNEEIVYDSPFIDEVEYYYDDSVTTGIDETYSIPDVPLNLDIYDLQGRKVKTPKSGNIYIMNGKKVVF